MNIAIIFAGGMGLRLNNSKESIPKQFLKINEKPILVHTLEKFQNHPEIDKIYIAILKEYKDYTKMLVDKFRLSKVKGIVEGGATAMESIYKGLLAAQKENPSNSIVLIHDGVRPIITDKVISDNIISVRKFGTGITSTPCYETILVSKDGKTPEHVPLRKETFAAQAPQSFILEEIIEANKQIGNYDGIVDSCTLFHVLGKETHLVDGNFGNIKVTTPQDVYILKGILEYLKEVEKEKCLKVETEFVNKI